MKRTVTMELTVVQAAKIYDLLGYGKNAEIMDSLGYTPDQEAAAYSAYDNVTQALIDAFGERLDDTRMQGGA